MNIDHLKKSVKLALRETFSTIKYGDNYRTPNSYIATPKNSPPFVGTLPKNISMQSISSYQEFPQLSKELLIELFTEIGVGYVPEICLYQLKEKRPIEVFQSFVLNFGVTMEDRLEQRETIDANILNRVILILKRMDKYREDNLFDSRGVHKLLAQHQFTEAEKMIDRLKK